MKDDITTVVLCVTANDQKVLRETSQAPTGKKSQLLVKKFPAENTFPCWHHKVPTPCPKPLGPDVFQEFPKFGKVTYCTFCVFVIQISKLMAWDQIWPEDCVHK